MLKSIEILRELWKVSIEIKEKQLLQSERETFHDGDEYCWQEGEYIRIWMDDGRVYDIGYYDSYQDNDNWSHADHFGRCEYCTELSDECRDLNEEETEKLLLELKDIVC